MQNSRFSKAALCSPVKSETYDKLEEDKKDILKKLHYLFVYYSAKASRYAYREITQKCFMELIADTYESTGRTLYKNSYDWKNFVTLYHGKGKKTGMVFDEFLKLLPFISTSFSHSNVAENDLKYLMRHLLLVYTSKVASQIEDKVVEFDRNFKLNTQEYIGKLAENLFIVYKIYFPQEITNHISHSHDPTHEMFQCLMTFFKEFQIYPKIVNASQLYLLFNFILQDSDHHLFSWLDHQQKRKYGSIGTVLTFSKFIEILVGVSRIGISKLREIDNPEWWIQRQKDSLKSLMEYMETTKTKNKNNKYKQIRFSFLVAEEYNESAEKWLRPESARDYSERRSDFFEMFEKMKL